MRRLRPVLAPTRRIHTEQDDMLLRYCSRDIPPSFEVSQGPAPPGRYER